MTYADRVKDTTTTTGIGPVTTAGSSPVGYQGISVLGGVGTSFPYAMAHVSLNEWETGIATITGTNTFSRAPTASSNGGALVPFSAGTKDVFCTAHADGLRRGLVDPDDVGYDIVLCIGQSNMVGRGTIDTLMDAVDSRVMQFGGASAQGRYRTIFSGASPTHNAETLQNTLSPQTHFGKAYAASIPANRSVLLVPCAYGGTTLVTPNFNGFTTAPWSVGSPGGSLYENAIAQANLALTEAQKTYPNSRIVGMIWHQGESDGDNNVSQSAYATALVAMIAGLRARITGAANAWFIIGGLMPEAIASNGAKYTAIRDAHIQVAAATSKCVYVAGPSGYQADTWHYTAGGSRILGARMALAVRSALFATGVDTTAPYLVGAQVANSDPTKIVITMSETLSASTPASSAFAVSGGKTVTGVAISGVTVTLTCSAPYTYSDTITVQYIKPGSGAMLQDAAANLTLSFGPASVTNNITAPASALTLSLNSTSVAQGSPVTATVGTNNPLTAGQSYSVTLSAPMAGTWSANPVVLTPGSPTATPTFTPSATGSGNITAAATGLTGASASFTATAADTTAPVFASAQVANANPDKILVTFSDASGALAASVPPNGAWTASGGRTVTGVSVAGLVATVTVNTPYASSDTITIAYTQPGANPRLQDGSGNAVTTFSAQSVTNNVAPPSLSLTSLTKMAATGTAGVYQASGNWWGDTGAGKLSVAFQNGVDGEFIVQMLDAPAHVNDATGREMGVGVDASGALTASPMGDYTSFDYFLMHRADGWQAYTNGSGAALDASGSGSAAQNDYLRARRVGSTLTLSVSHDAGSTWIVAKTFAGVPTTALYAYVEAIKTTSLKLISATGLA